MYHPRKSRKALAEPRSQPLLYGTNRRVEGFPYGLPEAIRQTTEEIIGIPLPPPPPQVRQAEESVRFQRPREHEKRIETGTANVEGFRS